MSCPLNRNRWAGSGYQKNTSAENNELDAKMKLMLAEREKQDQKLFPQTASNFVKPIAQSAPVIKNIVSGKQ